MGRPKKVTTNKVTTKGTKVAKKGRKKKSEVEVEFIGTVSCQPQHEDVENAKETDQEEEHEVSEKEQEPVENEENEEIADVNDQEEHEVSEKEQEPVEN